MKRWNCFGILLVLVINTEGATTVTAAPPLYKPPGKWDIQRDGLSMPHILKQEKFRAISEEGVSDSEASVFGNTGKWFKNSEHNVYESFQASSLINKALEKRHWLIANSGNNVRKSSKNADTIRSQRLKRNGNSETQNLFEKFAYSGQEIPRQEMQLPYQPVDGDLTQRTVGESKHYFTSPQLKETDTVTDSLNKAEHLNAGHYQERLQHGKVVGKERDIKIIEIHDGDSHGNVLEHTDDSGHHSLVYHVGIDSEHVNDHDEYSLHVQDCFVHKNVVHVIEPDNDTKLISQVDQPEPVTIQQKCTCQRNNY